MGVIIFNGVSSTDLHTLVQHPPEYTFPEKDYEAIHVPGRNGDIITDSGTWKNTERKYDLAIDARKISYTEIASSLVQWLHSTSTYARLEDSYEPDYYRMAVYKDTGSITNLYNKAGMIEVTFNCKPQRFLKSGEDKFIFANTGVVGTSLPNGTNFRNPTGFIAKPKIVVHGSGSGEISIGKSKVSISDIVDGMIIDSEIRNVYLRDLNLNSKVSFDDFPVLLPGDENNTVIFTGGITSIEITPRWWTL